MPTTRTLITEALPGQPQATGEPGRYMLRIITAGEGSSAIYPPEALQQAAQDRIFAFGTHMHLDHPTAAEERDRPVRSMKDLAGVFIEDAIYTDDEGGALDVPIKVAAPYQPLIADLWEHIGASIHAFVEVEEGTRPGAKPVASKFLPDPRNTVDFVTVAGRGGRVMEVLESASGQQVVEATTRERREQLEIVLKATYAPGDGQYIWVRDFDEDEHLVWFEDNSERCWQQAFTPADDDLSVALTGDPVEVRPTTTYVPVASPQESLSAAPEAAGQSESTQPKESLMDIDEAELAKLRAEAARAAQLQTERDEATARAEAAEAAIARGKEIDTALESVTVADPIKDRVRTVLEAHQGEITDQVVSEAVKAETEYLTKATEALGVGGIKGFGASQPATEATKPKRTRDAWGDPISKEK